MSSLKILKEFTNMKEIELPILWMDEKDCQLEDLGIKPTQDYTKTRNMTFYHINAISPHFENGQSLTIIHSNNDEFVSTIPYEEVKKRLKENY